MVGLQRPVVVAEGRQDRYKEPFVETIDEMAEQITAELAAVPAGPVAFFGHSMGAVLAFEVTRRLEAAQGRAPVTIFASGSRAPSRYGDEREHKDDRDLVDVMRQLGGTDPREADDGVRVGRREAATVIPTARSVPMNSGPPWTSSS